MRPARDLTAQSLHIFVSIIFLAPQCLSFLCFVSSGYDARELVRFSLLQLLSHTNIFLHLFETFFSNLN